MEETPKFIERIEEKFMPLITVDVEYNHDGNKRFLIKMDDAEKLVAMGGQTLGEDKRGRKSVAFGIGGKPTKWVPLYCNRIYEFGLASCSHADGGYYGCYACNEDGSIMEFYSSVAAEKAAFSLIGLKEWQNCHNFYAKKYQADRAEFETTNPVWAKWKSIDTPEMRATLSQSEYQTLKNLYEGKLNRDPDYQALEQLKQDVFDLDTYVKYLKKEEQRDKRNDLEEKLTDLKEEFSSPEMKEAIPHEGRRLSARGVMHKKLKSENGL